MPTLTLALLLSWWGQSTALLGAGWLGYQLALRREPDFRFNRYFLLLLPVLALALPPLLTLATPALQAWLPAAASGGVSAQLPGVLLPAVSSAAAGSTAPSASNWLLALYLTGLAASVGRLTWQLLNLWRQTRSLPREVRSGYVLVYTAGRLPVSSFGRWIFWDETAALTPAEAALMLRHEVAHVVQRHSLDRLLLELLRAVLWPNPFVHGYPRALELTHEYLADAAALGSGPTLADTTAYGALLARLALRRLHQSAAGLAHSFTYSPILSRIAMLTPVHPIRRWKQWLTVPTTLGLLAALALVNVACQSGPPPPPVPAEVPAPPPPSAVSPANLPPPPPVPPQEKVYDYADQMPEYPGGQSQLLQDVALRLQSPAAAKAAKLGGVVFVEFVVSAEGRLTDVTIKKGIVAPGQEAAARSLNEAALRVVRGLTATWTPGRLHGKAVAVSYIIPLRFAPHVEPGGASLISPLQTWNQVLSAC
ncbi:TonB family protein [Hymenobacter persicinus]|uniref:TonB family protein n=1 Tax=Hymenobacter persicinus TaxID=2025506 RepID=A0A4Q5LG52_9BACT|nr:TonB family protein [Hymenobacter persicinus]RYU80122.1 TonB family protein [Hymenobacter persicinus]